MEVREYKEIEVVDAIEEQIINKKLQKDLYLSVIPTIIQKEALEKEVIDNIPYEIPKKAPIIIDKENTTFEKIKKPNKIDQEEDYTSNDSELSREVDRMFEEIFNNIGLYDTENESNRQRSNR